MVLGREENLFEHGVINEPSDELIRLVKEGVRPILAVPYAIDEARRVLIAYSGSMESAKTMRQFVQMRLWPDMKLRIIMFNHSGGHRESDLEAAGSYCRAHGYDVDTELAHGPAKEKLLEHADQWKADLLVVGNSAKNLLLRKLFGETALHVLRNADRAIYTSQ